MILKVKYILVPLKCRPTFRVEGDEWINDDDRSEGCNDDYHCNSEFRAGPVSERSLIHAVTETDRSSSEGNNPEADVGKFG